MFANHESWLLTAVHAQVRRAQVMIDPHTGESRLFAFVEMDTPEEAERAISKLNRTELDGKLITVDRVCTGDLCVLHVPWKNWEVVHIFLMLQILALSMRPYAQLLSSSGAFMCHQIMRQRYFFLYVQQIFAV